MSPPTKKKKKKVLINATARSTLTPPVLTLPQCPTNITAFGHSRVFSEATTRACFSVFISNRFFISNIDEQARRSALSSVRGCACGGQSDSPLRTRRYEVTKSTEWIGFGTNGGVKHNISSECSLGVQAGDGPYDAVSTGRRD